VTYLLDANVFIQAKNLQYGFDFCPAFWHWIEREHRAGTVFSIEKIEDELAGQADELSLWAKTMGSRFFLPPDAPVIPALGAVSTWANTQAYEPAAVSTFLQVADYYLVAHALAHSLVVVTHEVPSSSVRKIKIPDVCIGIRVKFMTPYEMLRAERARFVLGL
jgi:hypothetical protein